MHSASKSTPLVVPATLPSGHFVQGFPEKTDSARKDLLQGFGGCQEFAKLAGKLTAADTFTPTGSANIILNLHRNADGSFLGVAKKNGKFIGHAHWVKATGIGARIVGSVAMLAGHAVLIDISMKLSRIESKLDGIEKLLNAIIWKSLEGDIYSVARALSLKKQENVSAILASTAPKLESDLRICIKTLANDIAGLKEIPEWHITRVVNDPTEEVLATLAKSETSYAYVMHGIRALGQLYVGLGEPEAAWQAMDSLLEDVSKVGLERAEWMARKVLPTVATPFPERFWMTAQTEVKAVLESVRRQAQDDGECAIEVEFTPEEMLAFQGQAA